MNDRDVDVDRIARLHTQYTYAFPHPARRTRAHTLTHRERGGEREGERERERKKEDMGQIDVGGRGRKSMIMQET